MSLSRYRDKYRFYACLLRARFDENKNEKDMIKATKMLKMGEEEFWANQHPQPYIFPDSPGGTSYERYECYKVRNGSSCSRVMLTMNFLFRRNLEQSYLNLLLICFSLFPLFYSQKFLCVTIPLTNSIILLFRYIKLSAALSNLSLKK